MDVGGACWRWCKERRDLGAYARLERIRGL